MKKLIVSILVLLSGSGVYAQKAKVVKTKGQQAIVQFPEGVTPEVGQTFNVGEEVLEDVGGAKSSGGGSRKKLLGISTELSMLSNSLTSKSTTAFTMSGRFGWNMKDFEAGPAGSIVYTSTDGRAQQLISAGGFLDVNLVPNDVGTDIVYGIGTEAEVGFYSDSSVTLNNYTSYNVFAGGFLKLFMLLKNTVAARADLGFDYTSYSNDRTSYSTSGLLAKGGLSVYF